MTTTVDVNPECSSCPLFGKHNWCTRIFQRWNWNHDIRRPELVILLFKMIRDHPEAKCVTTNPDMCEIENRRDGGIRLHGGSE